MNPHRTAKQRYENVIGEKELAVLKTDCLGTNQGVGLIACLVIIDSRSCKTPIHDFAGVA